MTTATASKNKTLTAPARTALEKIYNAAGRSLAADQIDGRVMRGLRSSRYVKNGKGKTVTLTDGGLRAYETSKTTATAG